MNFRYEHFKFKLDTKPLLFVAISGAHSYRTSRPDSDLDVRAVRFPPVEWALALSRNEKGKQEKHQGNVDIVTHNVYHFLNVLLHGNGTFLENLFQEHLWVAPGMQELTKLVREHGITQRMGGHYYGFVRSSRRDYNKKKRIKNLLHAYRVAMTGIHLFSTGEIEYNLNRLLELKQQGAWDVTIDHWTMMEALPDNIVHNVGCLLDMYNSETDLILPNHRLMTAHDTGILRELNCLQRIFGRYGISDKVDGRRVQPNTKFKLSSFIRDSQFPDTPRYAPFNNWLQTEMIERGRIKNE